MAKEATRNAYGKALAELVVERDDVLVLDADLTKSTKTIEAKKARPEHHFNMGIAEGNMMAVAAGMAASNKVVYASSFAMFAAGRAFEQIRNSICYPNLNVKVCATHAGITVGEDGASHQCIEDIALMRSIPNMKVFVPCDQYQAKAIVKAVADIDGPCYVRLGRCAVEDVYDESYRFELGKGRVLKEGKKVALVATGMMVQEALKAADILAKEDISITVVDMPCIKPIDEELIEKIAKSHELIITCEEHNVYGGLGSAVSEVTSKKSPVRME
ncbi:MAG: transketolase C-terminal domain-containing protein, partial [Holdemanella biformis]